MIQPRLKPGSNLLTLIRMLQSSASTISPRKLEDILNRLNVEAEDLREYILFSDRRYARNLVYKDKKFEVMVMCWKNGQRSSIHDHAGSLGGVKIINGCITECLFEKAPNGSIKSLTSEDYNSGNIRIEEIELIHQLSNLQPDNRDVISLHFYFPPLTKMNVFSLEDPAVKTILPQYFNFGGGI